MPEACCKLSWLQWCHLAPTVLLCTFSKHFKWLTRLRCRFLRLHRHFLWLLQTQSKADPKPVYRFSFLWWFALSYSFALFECSIQKIQHWDLAIVTAAIYEETVIKIQDNPKLSLAVNNSTTTFQISKESKQRKDCTCTKWIPYCLVFEWLYIKRFQNRYHAKNVFPQVRSEHVWWRSLTKELSKYISRDFHYVIILFIPLQKYQSTWCGLQTLNSS